MIWRLGGIYVSANFRVYSAGSHGGFGDVSVCGKS
jgi:hypothetical protein